MIDSTNWNNCKSRSLIVAAIGVVGCLASAFLDVHRFFQAYLMGYAFWASIGIGSLGFLILYHLVGGGWGRLARPMLEAGALTMPVLFLLLVPLFFGFKSVFPWAQPGSPEVHSTYMGAPFFILRAAIYFALYSWFAYKFSTAKQTQGVAGITMVAYVVIVTFFSFDWLMSLEPHWSSSIFGAMIMVGMGLAAMAFTLVIMRSRRNDPETNTDLFVTRLHDLGNLMFAFIILWAYTSFSQYTIIWHANLPEEISWYIHRQYGGWGWWARAILIFHFAVPFFTLLARDIKRNVNLLSWVAAYVLFARWIDLYWIVIPSFCNGKFRFEWMTLPATLAIGGIWVWAFIGRYQKTTNA